MIHILLVGAWPELVGQLVGLPARTSLLQLPDTKDNHLAELPFRRVPVDYRDVDPAQAAPCAIDRDDPLDAVIGLREFALPATAAIARALRLRCVPGPVASLGRNKAEVRRLLADGGCLPVRHRECASAEEVRDFAAWVAAPVVVKPLAGAGSVGVHAVADGDDAAIAYAHARDVPGGSHAVLVEELIAGPEFSVETRSVAGTHEVVAITEKRTTGPPYFVETGHVMPARLAAPAAAALGDEATLGLTAIGHLDGPSHVELILTSRGPAIVEINRRIGGDRIWELLMLALDRNLMVETLRDVAGLPTAATGPPATAPAARGAVIRYLTAAGPPRPAERPGADALADIPGVIRCDVTADAASGSATTSLRRLGYVLAVGDTPWAAAAAADAAHDRLITLLTAPVGARA